MSGHVTLPGGASLDFGHHRRILDMQGLLKMSRHWTSQDSEVGDASPKDTDQRGCVVTTARWGHVACRTAEAVLEQVALEGLQCACRSWRLVCLHMRNQAYAPWACTLPNMLVIAASSPSVTEMLALLSMLRQTAKP